MGPRRGIALVAVVIFATVQLSHSVVDLSSAARVEGTADLVEDRAVSMLETSQEPEAAAKEGGDADAEEEEAEAGVAEKEPDDAPEEAAKKEAAEEEEPEPSEVPDAEEAAKKAEQEAEQEEELGKAAVQCEQKVASLKYELAESKQGMSQALKELIATCKELQETIALRRKDAKLRRSIGALDDAPEAATEDKPNVKSKGKGKGKSKGKAEAGEESKSATASEAKEDAEEKEEVTSTDKETGKRDATTSNSTAL